MSKRSPVPEPAPNKGVELTASSVRSCVAPAFSRSSRLALVFCKKCKHFFLRHTSGNQFCGENWPVMMYVRCHKGDER